ncbi:MAG: CoA-binding protein [Gemmatimonadales bacterium]
MPLNDADLRQLLGTTRRIAVVGLSPNPRRPSHGVAAYLQAAGFRIVPVRPGVTEVLGEPAHPDLVAAARTGPIDVVDVFRRSDAISSLVAACIEIRPRLVFLQEGVSHPASERLLEEAGIPVISDRCLMVDHQRLLGH